MGFLFSIFTIIAGDKTYVLVNGQQKYDPIDTYYVTK